MSERLSFAFWAAKLTLEGDKTRPNQEKNAKKFHFARQNGIFCIFLRRVRDWKGYGIAEQCGTCEPLQSPTV